MNEEINTAQQLNASSEIQTLDITAVSKELGVSRATVLRWAHTKKIEGFFQINKKWLIRKVDFDNFINRKINRTQ